MIAEATAQPLPTATTNHSPTDGDGDSNAASLEKLAGASPDSLAESWDASRISDDTLRAVLRKVWGHKDFRGSQLPLVRPMWLWLCCVQLIYCVHAAF